MVVDSRIQYTLYLINKIDDCNEKIAGIDAPNPQPKMADPHHTITRQHNVMHSEDVDSPSHPIRSHPMPSHAMKRMNFLDKDTCTLARRGSCRPTVLELRLIQ